MNSPNFLFHPPPRGRTVSSSNPAGRRRGVRIVCRPVETGARPKARADLFVRVSRPCDHALARRRRTSAKPRASQVEAAPEKMHRAGFPDEAPAEFLHHVLRRNQHLKEAPRHIRGSYEACSRSSSNGVVTAISCGLVLNRDVDPQAVKRLHQRRVELRHRNGPQRQGHASRRRWSRSPAGVPRNRTGSRKLRHGTGWVKWSVRGH